MAGHFSIKSGKSGPKSVPTPGANASFVLGSRPTTLRAAPPPRIKPTLAVRDYGKTPAPARQTSPFGDTGMNDGS